MTASGSRRMLMPITSDGRMAEVSWNLSWKLLQGNRVYMYRLSALKRSTQHSDSLSNIDGHGTTVSATGIIGARACSSKGSKFQVGQLSSRANSLPSTRPTLRRPAACKPGDSSRKTPLLLQYKESGHSRGAQRHSRLKSQSVHGTLRCCKSPSVTSSHLLLLDIDAKPLIKVASIFQGSQLIQHEQDDQPSLYLSPSVPLLSHANQIVGRMTCWKRRILTATFHPESFGWAQQRERAFSTVILADQLGLGQRVSPLRPYRAMLAAPTTGRDYSRGSRNSSDTPPLYRSKTAYYDILRVSSNATRSQIKTAYYKQSFIYHPDKNQGSKDAMARFSEITEAYNILGSISLRRKYDRGILSQADVHGAGRPSTKENVAASSGQQKQRTGYMVDKVGKPIFDFDAFYQAHYGEQLQREKLLREKKEEQKKKKDFDARERKEMEKLAIFILVGGALVIGLTRVD